MKTITMITPATVKIATVIDSTAHDDAALIWAEIDAAHGDYDYWAVRSAHIKELCRIAAPSRWLNATDHAVAMQREIVGDWPDMGSALMVSGALLDIERIRAALAVLRRAVERGELLPDMAASSGCYPLHS